MRRRLLILPAVLAAVVAALCVLLFVRPILPGHYVEIVYPPPDAMVSPEFAVLGASAKRSGARRRGFWRTEPGTCVEDRIPGRSCQSWPREKRGLAPRAGGAGSEAVGVG